jgi:hypothetical protein
MDKNILHQAVGGGDKLLHHYISTPENESGKQDCTQSKTVRHSAFH